MIRVCHWKIQINAYPHVFIAGTFYIANTEKKLMPVNHFLLHSITASVITTCQVHAVIKSNSNRNG